VALDYDRTGPLFRRILRATLEHTHILIFRARFVLPFVVVATCLGACSHAPDPGYLELQHSQEAVQEATSWQNDATAKSPTGQAVIVELSKVDCPGRMERVGILHEMHNISVREISLDGTYYNKIEGVTVRTSHRANLNPFSECGRGPYMIWDSVLYGDLKQVHAAGEIRRGKADNYDNVSCVWWAVIPAKGALPHYSACVGETDRLPRLVNSLEHDLHYTYWLSRWNATVITLPPKARVIPN
jgi:hypothetical protein